MEVFKRLAAQPSKAPQPPKSSRPSKARQPEKAGQSRKTSWNSQEEWDRDRPTVKWIFPFIDKNNDGKIDSDEYQAIQEYKKKHADWMDRARKEIGVTSPKDQ